MEERVIQELSDAEVKAWEALSGYKFWMFGYHAARWVTLNRLLPSPHPNPFKDAVHLARQKIETREEEAAVAAR